MSASAPTSKDVPADLMIEALPEPTYGTEFVEVSFTPYLESQFRLSNRHPPPRYPAKMVWKR